MNQTSLPLYPKATLFKALSIAVIVAVVIFVTLIMPVEYETDPSGVGSAIGLTALNTDPAVAAPVMALNAIATTPSPSGVMAASQSDVVAIVIPAQSALEYKFSINQHDTLDYEWSTDSGQLYFDFHGDPKGDTTGYFKSYTKTTSAQIKGSMLAPFDGQHGWYWKNTSDKKITVTLKTEGTYKVLGIMH